MARFLILFPILFALLELAVLVELGDAVGTFPVLGLVVAGLIGGVMLMRRGGLGALQRAQRTLAQGEAPVGELFDIACLVLAGLLLMFPGVISDLLALPLIIPQTRAALLRRLGRHFGVYRARSEVIEGEWHEIRDEATRLPR